MERVEFGNLMMSRGGQDLSDKLKGGNIDEPGRLIGADAAAGIIYLRSNLGGGWVKLSVLSVLIRICHCLCGVAAYSVLRGMAVVADSIHAVCSAEAFCLPM